MQRRKFPTARNCDADSIFHASIFVIAWSWKRGAIKQFF